jgi:hypothetical protein
MTNADGSGWTNSIVSMLLFGILVAIPGIVAWANVPGRGFTKAFRVGPALLIPAVFLWAVISNLSCPGESVCRDALWRRLPIYAADAIAVLWNLALVAIAKERILYVLYAIIFLPSFYLFCAFAIVLAIKFPL